MKNIFVQAVLITVATIENWGENLSQSRVLSNQSPDS